MEDIWSNWEGKQTWQGSGTNFTFCYFRQTELQKRKILQIIQGRQDNFSTKNIIPVCSINIHSQVFLSLTKVRWMLSWSLNDYLPSIRCWNSSFPLITDSICRSRAGPDRSKSNLIPTDNDWFRSEQTTQQRPKRH